jgi:transcriptional regulator with XRE-family HTH domain
MPVLEEKYRIFRELLISARRTSGLTQSQLASKLHRQQSYVSKYENGERRLDVLEFLEVADELKLNVTAFLKKIRAVDGI